MDHVPIMVEKEEEEKKKEEEKSKRPSTLSQANKGKRS